VSKERARRLTKILMAVDGSEISRNTADISIELARIFGIKILGLYVVDEELAVNDYADYRNELGVEDLSLSRADRAALFETRGREILQWLEFRCRESGIGVTTQMGLGGVGKTVLEAARKADVLAVGRRGNGHPDSVDYLGKNFRRITHQRKIPLLAGGDRVEPLRKILIAYKGGEQGLEVLNWAKRFQKRGEFELTALVVQEDDDRDTQTWEEELQAGLSKKRNGKIELITARGKAADQIIQTAMKTGSDLIIMGGYSRKGLLEWLEGSTLDSVLRKSRLPVLAA
jgi:nucleotide-binding universal stress UspA family protein